MNFIAGLPRAGSTLLAALLRQNPAIDAGISTPLLALVRGAVNEMAIPANQPFFDASRRRAILSALIGGYYAHAQFPLDTNRAWTSHLALLAELFPSSRVICCVRNLGDVLNSFERILASNPDRASSLFGFKLAGNVYSRADQLMDAKSGAMGSAYASLKQGWFGPNADRLVVIDYERLVSDPLGVVKRLYTLCGWGYFKHDPDRVSFDAPAFDAVLGMPGLHRIAGPVAAPRREMYLPPDLYDKFKDSAFWLNPEMNFRGVEVLAPLTTVQAVAA